MFQILYTLNTETCLERPLGLEITCLERPCSSDRKSYISIKLKTTCLEHVERSYFYGPWDGAVLQERFYCFAISVCFRSSESCELVVRKTWLGLQPLVSSNRYVRECQWLQTLLLLHICITVYNPHN